MSKRMDRLMILLPARTLARIDEYRRRCADLPARTEAIRRLIDASLDAAERRAMAEWTDGR